MARLSETEACGFEDLFADVQTRAGHHRHVPRDARDDPSEADSRVPVGRVGPIRVYKRARPADAPKPLLDPEKRHARTKCAKLASRRTDGHLVTCLII